MGFFAGLASGFKTGRQMKADKEETDRLAEYRKSEQDYRTSRDNVTDNRYLSEREEQRKRQALEDTRYTDELMYGRSRDTIADEAAALERQRSDIRWEKEFGLQKKASDRADSQWNATFDYRKERDSVSDDQWSKQQADVAAAAEESRRRFEMQFEFTADESDKAAERWKSKFGFDQDRALKADEWQVAMQEYRETRDSISDEQWGTTFDYTQAQAATAEERWKVEHGFRKEQALTAEQQWEAEKAWREERAEVADQQFDTQLSDKRMETLINAGLTPGGTAGGTGDKTTKKGNTATDMLESQESLKFRVDGAELDDDAKKYFDVILEDPGAAHKIYRFITEQATKNNVIDIADIPSLIQIAGVSGGKGEEAMALLKSNGVDVEDQDAFFSALQTLKEHSPSKVSLDISADAYRNPNDIKVIKDQRDLLIDISIPTAQAILSGLPKGDPARNALSQALANIESSDKVIKSKAISTIMQYVVTPDTIARLESRGGAFKGLSTNEFLLPYLQEEEPVEQLTAAGDDVQGGAQDGAQDSAQDSAQDGVQGGVQGGVLPEANSPVERTVLDDKDTNVPSFDSAEEYTAWRSEGNSGPVIVMGQRGVAQPIETVEEPAVEPTVLDDTPVSEGTAAQGLADLAREQGIRSTSALNKFIFQNVEPVKGDRKATSALQRQMFEELSAILGL